MSSICKGCNKDYKYPSRLTKHRNGFYGCKYDDTVSTILNVNNNTFNCDKCDKSFMHKSSLTRHITNLRCASANNTTNNNTTNINTTNNNTTNNNSGTINDNRQITNITNNSIINNLNIILSITVY